MAMERWYNCSALLLNDGYGGLVQLFCVAAHLWLWSAGTAVLRCCSMMAMEGLYNCSVLLLTYGYGALVQLFCAVKLLHVVVVE